ncbi:hypothetical protein ACFQZZ_14190 [Nocardia sp. GCM10030253]|uniref:hypothetical protein n=1 Tax=Nocardia sp. GCM10030253 TaxID=3273404 RepID=UPI00362BC170
MADGWEIANALGTIVGATGTVVAVVVALGISIRDGRAIRAQRNDDLAAQARSVVSEVPSAELIRISNHSREPILSVWITALNARLDRADGTQQHYQGSASPDLNGVVAPGSGWDVSVSLHNVAAPSQSLRPADDEKWHVEVTFRVLDAGGTWWERVDNGPPKRVRN